MKSASAVGSLIGSLANGVSRFSRLLPDQVCAEPDAVTMVPKRGLAMTFDPRHRRFLGAVEDDRVGPAVVGEAAEAVASASSTAAGDVGVAMSLGAARRRRHERRRRAAGRHPGRSSCAAQIAAVAARMAPGHRFEQHALGVAHPVGAQQIGAAGPMLPRAPRPVLEDGR